MAEWLRSGLQNRLLEFNSRSGLNIIKVFNPIVILTNYPFYGIVYTFNPHSVDFCFQGQVVNKVVKTGGTHRIVNCYMYTHIRYFSLSPQFSHWLIYETNS